MDDVREMRAAADAELAAAIEDTHQELFNLRFQRSLGRLSDTSRLRVVRRRLARLKTVQRERELWAAYAAGLEEEG